MRRALPAIVALLLAGPVHAAVDSQAVEEAARELHQCYRDNIAILDDGVSDAATIAGAVLPNCNLLFEGVLSLMTVDSPKRMIPQFREQLTETMTKSATMFVLHARAAARSKAQAKPKTTGSARGKAK